MFAPLRITLMLGDSSFCIYYRRISATILPRTSCSVTANRSNDEATVRFHHSFSAQTEPVHDAGSKVFHHNIAKWDETHDEFRGFGL